MLYLLAESLSEDAFLAPKKLWPWFSVLNFCGLIGKFELCLSLDWHLVSREYHLNPCLITLCNWRTCVNVLNALLCVLLSTFQANSHTFFYLAKFANNNLMNNWSWNLWEFLMKLVIENHMYWNILKSVQFKFVIVFILQLKGYDK